MPAEIWAAPAAPRPLSWGQSSDAKSQERALQSRAACQPAAPCFFKPPYHKGVTDLLTVPTPPVSLVPHIPEINYTFQLYYVPRSKSSPRTSERGLLSR